MQKQLEDLIRKQSEYNEGDMVMETFGLDRKKHYDVIVIAPGWKPTKILSGVDVAVTAVHSYFSGYEVKIGNRLIGWMQTAAGGCNLIDGMILCADLDFDKLVFAGAVGGLKPGFAVGDVCTPSYCVEGGMANAYLQKDIRDFRPFGRVYPGDPDFVERVSGQAEAAGVPMRQASVYCTDSIAGEYYHLDFIKSFDTDLIEMETGSFYRLAAMMEKPAVAILVVSDNSATGAPLLGRPEVQQDAYNTSRRILLAKLLEIIANM